MFAQVPACVWANDIGGDNHDISNSIAVDDWGNTYVTGKFLSATLFSASIPLLSNAGNFDMFLVKYDLNGNLVWAKKPLCFNSEESKCVVADHFGNVYVAGQFSGQWIAFGTDTLFNPNFFSTSFLVKYDSNGNVIWVRNAGRSAYEFINSIAVDNAGNVNVAGYFTADTMFIGADTLINAGNADIFIAKYDSSGNVIWSQRIGGVDYDIAEKICVDGSGMIYMTGEFRSSNLQFGNNLISYSNASGLFPSSFIAKYDSSGNAIRAACLGVNDQIITGIGTDSIGNLFVSGNFSDSLITIGSYQLINPGSGNLFVIKYDSSGVIQWVESATTNNSFSNPGDFVKAMAVDKAGNLFLTGNYGGTNFQIGNQILTNSVGGGDLFFAKIDSSGNCNWLYDSSSGLAFRDGTGVAFDFAGNAVFTGWYLDNTITLGNFLLTNNGSNKQDVFVVKIGYSTNVKNQVMNSMILNIYPNPTLSTFTLTANTPLTNPQIEICNMMGAIVYSEKIKIPIKIGTNFSKQINLNAPAGIYFVKLNDGERQYTKKLVVE